MFYHEIKKKPKKGGSKGVRGRKRGHSSIYERSENSEKGGEFLPLGIIEFCGLGEKTPHFQNHGLKQLRCHISLMPWMYTDDVPETVGIFRKKPTGKIIKVPQKEFLKDNSPDPEYWGSGMYSLINSKERERPPSLVFKEAIPILQDPDSPKEFISKPVASSTVRSFEIWKESDSNVCKIILGAVSDSDLSLFADSLQMELKSLPEGMDEPEFVSKEKYDEFTRKYGESSWFGYDIEQDHQMNFTAFDIRQMPVINSLIRVISSNRIEGIWFQMSFMTYRNLPAIAENHANVLSTFINTINDGVEVSKTTLGNMTMGKMSIPIPMTSTEVKRHPLTDTTVYTMGRQILPSVYEKCHQSLTLLSIRFIVRTNDPTHSTAKMVQTIFQNVSILSDSLSLYDCTDPRVVDIFRNRLPTSSEAINIIESNANMWNDTRWGIGRDLSPNLCLNPQELKIFVSSPTDPNLGIKFTRKRLKGIPPNVNVLGLGWIVD